MKRITLLTTILFLFLTCSLSKPEETKQVKESTDAILSDEPDIKHTQFLTSLTPTLDFTETLTNTAKIKLSNSGGDNYPYEIINHLEWLSFSNLTGTVSSNEEVIMAYVDFKQFSVQEIKEGTITINSDSESISIPVCAQNYFYSDNTTVLKIDHNIFTIYNKSEKSLSFNISNSYQGDCMVYSFSTEEEWLDFDLPEGYILGTETIDIPIFIDWSLIENKNLTRGYITVTNHTDPIQTETITIKARSEPELYVSKKSLTQKSNTYNSNTFEVGNILANSLPYTISADKSWVSFNKTAGTVTKGNNDLIEVNIDYSDFIEDISETSIITITSKYGNETILLTATGYPSFKTSSVNMYLKSIAKPTEILSITNTGCGVAKFNLSTDTDILNLSQTSGSLNHSESVEIIISADFDSLNWDTYTYSEINLHINSEVKLFKIKSMREVDPQQDPRLSVNRSSIPVLSTLNSTESFTITNKGTGIMECNITASDPWITSLPNSISINEGLNDLISFDIESSLIEPGHNGYIKITTNGVYSNSHIININVE